MLGGGGREAWWGGKESWEVTWGRREEGLGGARGSWEGKGGGSGRGWGNPEGQ